jgi:hypothetical protein
MKFLLYTMALCGALLPMAGCETIADTPGENRVRMSHAAIIDLKQVPEDLERILYLDRPVWLSRYPISND